MSGHASRYDPAHHGPRRIVGPGFHEQVWAVVVQVPAGAVTTYGDVAGALGRRSVARHVGHALAALPKEQVDVPWHRVVNATGRISDRRGGPSREQVQRLTQEGVALDANGRIQDFAMLRWVFDDAGPA